MFEDWESATSIARAFSIGAKESHAVANLQSRVAKSVLDELKLAAAKRGVKNFITHDLISRDLFSDGFTSGQGDKEAWGDVLTNASGQQLVACCYY